MFYRLNCCTETAVRNGNRASCKSVPLYLVGVGDVGLFSVTTLDTNAFSS